MKLAAKYRIPVICLIDTPGAFPGIGAEERGQSQLIATSILEMTRLPTAIICVVIGEGVECPALSPDNSRIAFKKRLIVGGRMIWRLAVFDLATSEQRLVEGETKSVDDQVQWLDNNRILYAVADEVEGRSGTSLWVADVTGGASSLWAGGAYSPSVVRP